MTRDAFKEHVAQTIESLIQEAESRSGRSLARRFCFGFMNPSRPLVPQEEVVEHLTNQIFVDEQSIYPCFDLYLCDLLDDGRLLFCGYRAGYQPRPWQKNWTGRDGPFVRGFSELFLKKLGINPNDITKPLPGE